LVACCSPENTNTTFQHPATIARTMRILALAVSFLLQSSTWAMNDIGLIEAIVEDSEFGPAEVGRWIGSWTGCVSSRLQRRKVTSVALPGFGTFVQGEDALDDDSDGDGFCDGIDNDCDVVVCDALKTNVCDEDTGERKEVRYDCKQSDGSDPDCTAEGAFTDGVDDDCDGAVDESVRFDADDDVQGDLLPIRAASYWLDVTTQLATDYNSSRSNKRGRRRLLETQARLLENRARSLRGLQLTPYFETVEVAADAVSKTGEGEPTFSGTILGTVSFFLGVLNDLSLKGMKPSEAMTVLRKSTEEFVANNWSPPLSPNDAKVITEDTIAYFKIAYAGAPKEDDFNNSISLESSDQIEIMQCMEEDLKDAGNDDDSNIALKLLLLQDTIIQQLKKGDSISLVGFGTFSISKRAARTGRNPQTGKAIKIAAKNVVKFKAGSELSKKVN